MFEGQNIHLSPVDGKRLCSFSQKICKQHRLNGFAFCIRHILEDKNSPFKQCQYKTKANGERCFNPVPEAEERVYCNSHLQVLGMIPKNANKQCQDKKKMAASKGKNKKDSSHGNKKTSHVTKDSSVPKISKKAKKILKDDYTKESKVKENWYAIMTKLFKRTAYNLHTWQKSELGDDVQDFLKTKKYQRRNEDFFRVHVIDDYDIEESDDERTGDVIQTMFLNSNERVHHNQLCVDPPSVQEEKMLLKIKHCNGQLRQVINSNKERNGLSYSVLSKLISSARESATETANILNLASGTTSHGSFRLHRERKESVSYQVPCTLLSSDVCCTKMAMPYTKYCCDHISRDHDQYLFSSVPTFDVTNPLQLHFLRAVDVPSESFSSASNSNSATSNQQKRKGDTPPVSQSKRSYQKVKPNVEEKRIKKKKSKTKKKSSKRPTNTMRDEMQKQFDIPTQPPQKINAHLKKSAVEENTEGFVKLDEMLANSNSEVEEDDDDDDADDILTPEEAFHLPPGSLSFSPRMVDDDSLPTIQNRTLDEEDDELIRCTNNFPFDSNSQLSRDIGSPTLNQLSSSDFQNTFNSIFMSPAKTLDPNPPLVNTSKTNFKQPFSPPSSRPNNPPHSNTRLPHPNPANGGSVNEQKSGSTTLKISHVDMLSKPSGKIDHNALYTKKLHQDDRSIRSNSFNPISTQENKLMLEYRSNGMASVNSHSMSSYPHLTNGLVSRNHNSIPMKETVGFDQTSSLSKRYLSDSLLLQQPLSQDSTLFDDINTDVESPLEKVNPDIFFSSVFPVSTSTENM